MYYNSVEKIGKIKEYDKEFGVGHIVSVTDIYLFTIDDINEEIHVGDIVKFRGEKHNNINRAYFVSKINNNYYLKNNIIKSKVFNKEKK